MSRDFFAVTRNALTNFCSAIYSLQQVRALQPHRTIHGFRPLRRITRVPPDHRLFPGRGVIPCPPYPYGARHTFKEADKGLYGSATLQSGNKISQGRNKGKTRRRWFPNVRLETIRSEALNETMTIPITAACMRTIRKCGGLDQYLLGDKPARIKELGVFGWRLRWKVMSSPTMIKKYQAERNNLGLSPNRPPLETFDEAWERDEELRKEVQQEQEKQWLGLKEKDERFQRHVKSRWQSSDKKSYSPAKIVPPFDEAAFRLLLPEEYTEEDLVQEGNGQQESAQAQ
jgi:large subunit ribosomal protein L28